MYRWSKWGTLAGCAAVVIAFACATWSRRWISDDGLIVVRTVRELLAGNGPNYNAFERAEADTSTLWTYLVALFALVTRADVTRVAIGLGGSLTVAGLAIALDASRRLHRSLGATGPLLPCGVLVMIGAYPFWDYATSGLENGLVIFWLASTWWLLLSLARETPARRQRAIAFAFGLGPLVRPELGMATFVLLGAGWVLVRPTRRRAVGLVAIAFALPIAYEIFRAGYYGMLVPLPALAKSATSAQWHRGWAYMRDFARPYLLWIPLVVLAALLGGAIARRRELDVRARVAIAAPIAIGALLGLYVVRVGGDFMHGRMALAPLFAAVLPAAVLPVRRATAPAIAALAIWGVAVGLWRDDHESHSTVDGIEDEHAGYVVWTSHAHPTDAHMFVHADRPGALIASNELDVGRRMLIHEYLPLDVPMNPELPGPIVYAAGRLGTGGAIAPLDGIVADTLGLANPVGAHLSVTNPGGMPGHEKVLPETWLLADFAAPEVIVPDVAPADVAAARHAFGCGAIAELRASAREPLTALRFWDNLIGSVARTRLVIPGDPHAAEALFCGSP